MNKTLIELMLEANVEWPEGAEFAAQDGRDKLLFFSARKPTLRALDDVWKMDTSGFDLESIGELASNWREYITRAEYEAAQDKAERDRIFGDKDEPCESAKVSLRKAFGHSDNAKSSCFSYELKESFKDAALEHKLKRRQVVVDGIEANKEQLAEFTETLRLVDENIAADLAALGWGERVVKDTVELEDEECQGCVGCGECGYDEPYQAIDAWRILKLGDIVILKSPQHDTVKGKPAKVIQIDESDRVCPIRVEIESGSRSWGREFEFISRPSTNK